ncbi:DUF742 domain-containing protein [Streptomyces sp. NPDC091377]|uniref:DUF742 domain-containing protein n=1 Tax=Streptomyces sp. NPDC091377 TaxID=3365995 RepID=UPI0037FD070F
MPGRTGTAWTRQPAETAPLFVVVGGPVRPAHPLRVETMLSALDPPPPTGTQPPEAEQAISLCRGQPSSVAEIAVLLDLPVHLVKSLLSRQIDAGTLTVCVPQNRSTDQTITLLEAVRDGLRRAL